MVDITTTVTVESEDELAVVLGPWQGQPNLAAPVQIENLRNLRVAQAVVWRNYFKFVSSPNTRSENAQGFHLNGRVRI